MSDIAVIASNLHRLSSVLGRIADRKLQESCGLGMSQFKILWMLKKHSDGVLQTTIASWLSQTEAAVSRQIRLLKKEGLIEKRTDPKNRRNHIIMLSSEGDKFAESAMKMLVKEYKPIFAGLTAEDRRVFNALLEKTFIKACDLAPEGTLAKGNAWKK